MSDKVPAGVLVLKLIDGSVDLKIYFSECENELPDIMAELSPGTTILANVADPRIATLIGIYAAGVQARCQDPSEEEHLDFLYKLLKWSAANQAGLSPFIGPNEEESPDLESILEYSQVLFKEAGRAREGIELLCVVLGMIVCSMMERKTYGYAD